MWYAMDILMQQQFKRIDISKLLVYFIDVVDERMLPFLAEEFDVLGKKGWEYADTVPKKRALLKDAVILHRYWGTPWAVERVVAQAGLTDAVLVENTGTDPDTGWALFRIDVDFTTLPPEPEQIANATELVNIWKRASCVLEGIFYTGLDFTEVDGLAADEELFVAAEVDPVDDMGVLGGFPCDGSVLCDGSHNCIDELDTIVINIV